MYMKVCTSFTIRFWRSVFFRHLSSNICGNQKTIFWVKGDFYRHCRFRFGIDAKIVFDIRAVSWIPAFWISEKSYSGWKKASLKFSVSDLESIPTNSGLQPYSLNGIRSMTKPYWTFKGYFGMKKGLHLNFKARFVINSKPWSRDIMYLFKFVLLFGRVASSIWN